MMDSHVHRQNKRMRKGTHSCSECRERKVKCIFTSSRDTCDDCLRRGKPCKEQAGGEIVFVPDGHERSTQDQLREIDKNVKIILQSLGRGTDTTIAADAHHHTHIQLLERLQLELARSRFAAVENSTQSSTPSSTILSDQFTHDVTGEDNAKVPILSLVTNSVFQSRTLDPLSEYDSDARTHVRASDRVIRILRNLIPEPFDLLKLLKATNCKWDVWGDLIPSLKNQMSDAAGIPDDGLLLKEVRLLIDTDELGKVVKIFLCLATCFQQLPQNFDFRQTSLPPEPEILQERFLSAGESVLSMDQGLTNTIEGMECLLIQSKYYINRGKPRTAWLICQRGMSICHVLGINGLSIADTTIKTRWKKAWFELWSQDRQLSLLLGVPQASSIGPTEVIDITGTDNESKWQAAFTNLAILAGSVNTRNQSSSQMTFPATLAIEADMEVFKRSMSTEWEVPKAYDHYSFHEMETKQQSELIFHSTRKLLHLPFMLKAMEDSRYEFSREAALQSSRQIIRIYQTINGGERPSSSLCNLQDFQTFTASLVLVVNLLGPRQDPLQRQGVDDMHDWQLVDEVTQVFAEVATKRGCVVASDASSFLKEVSRFRYDSPHTQAGRYEAMIPYFGRISLTRKQLPTKSADQSGPSSIAPAYDLNSSGGLIESGQRSEDVNVVAQARLECFAGLDPFMTSLDNSGWPISGDALNIDWNNCYGGS